MKGALALTGASLATGFYTWQIEPFWVEFVSLKMPLPHLPDYWQGKTLMQISDMHVGKRFDRQYLIDAFNVAKTFEPDVVVYTGDFVNYKNSEQFGQLDEVLAQAVLGKEQTWGILGNHDYGKNWAESEVAEKITQIATKNGITMLRNEKISVEGLTIIGLDDFWG